MKSCLRNKTNQFFGKVPFFLPFLEGPHPRACTRLSWKFSWYRESFQPQFSYPLIFFVGVILFHIFANLKGIKKDFLFLRFPLSALSLFIETFVDKIRFFLRKSVLLPQKGFKSTTHPSRQGVVNKKIIKNLMEVYFLVKFSEVKKWVFESFCLRSQKDTNQLKLLDVIGLIKDMTVKSR